MQTIQSVMTVKYTVLTFHSKKWIRFSDDTISPVALLLFYALVEYAKIILR
jgi:hypothetical protein